jgi:hypothetical protein
MQIFGPGKPSVGVVYDASFGTSIDGVLALALLYGLQGKNESRVISISVSRSSLNAAIFANVLVRFYTGEPNPFMGITPVGLTLSGKLAEDTPMISAVVGRTTYPRDIYKMNDTADPVATIRNALTAQHDQNAIVVLAGPATNLAGVLALPGATQLIAAKVRHLVIAAGSQFEADPAAAKAVFSAWPSPIVLAGADAGEAIPFPAGSIEKDFAWSDKHPVVDAWRACRPEGGDAPAPALAAALYAVRSDKDYFLLSDPGTISIDATGSPRFTPAPGGKHRTLIADPAKKEAVQQAYAELASTKPVGRPPRFRPQQKKQ